MILPNFKVPLAIEGHNAIIAADVTCAGSQHGYDSVRAEEGSLSELLRAVSERYLLPSVCPCFVKSDDRIDKILNTIREHRIDAVVYHTLRLCLPFDVESRKLNDVLQAEGVPFLSINTDYSKEDLGQLGTRVEAFLEMINARKNV
jgi:benzoyl-CoA reductase/2-hydroxyglutaryl-CoA dehydratase subunit BcrC/BadD/HgdB